jgi:hypothetical protein
MNEAYNIEEFSKRFVAQYTPASIAEWRDNPFIEALPELYSENEFIFLVSNLPDPEKNIQELPKELRIVLIDNLTQITVPTQQLLLIKQRFDRIIRYAYQARNPIDDPFFTTLNKKLIELGKKPRIPQNHLVSQTPPGFTILGMGGVGKSHAVATTLSLFEQIIVHRSYRDSKNQLHYLNKIQIVYLRLICPPDGTLKSLCNNFFIEVDRITGITNYSQKHGSEARSGEFVSSRMVPQMALVASLVSLGVLVIDEIQNLSKQKSGGKEAMLQFFTFLMEEMKIPVVLIGTPKAEDFLNLEFWQMRRNAGQGEIHWQPLRHHKADAKISDDTPPSEWDLFLLAIWKYQYIDSPIPLVNDKVPEDFSRTLFDESQGIIDFALKLFRLTQEHSLNTKSPMTTQMIVAVSKRLFKKMREVIQAYARSGKQDAVTLSKINDIRLKTDISLKEHQQRRTSIDPKTETTDKVPKKTPQQKIITTETISILEIYKNVNFDPQNCIQVMKSHGYICDPQEFLV